MHLDKVHNGHSQICITSTLQIQFTRISMHSFDARLPGICKKRKICVQELICDAFYKTLRLSVSVKKLTSGLVAVFTIVSFQVRVYILLFFCHHSVANFRAYMCMHRQEVQDRLMKNPMHNIPFLLPQAYPSCPIMTVFKWL